uniref:SRCR domain-containing protein n=1 Tax=Globodera pallida TaxID=36090 RepID=A0A183C0J1_GLOPA
MQNFVILFLLSFLAFLFGTVHSQQPPLADGLEPTRQRIRNTLGGFYSGNVTLFFRNSPYRVERELIVESGSTMTIETGVQMYFDTGIGMKVFGTLQAIGNEFAHIQMLPYQQQLVYDGKMPDFRLIDGPTVRQGRLQARFRNRWRSVCTQLTNWTSIDTGTACRSMGFSDGAFWRFFRRNNDTYPIVMPNPECPQDKNSLWNCPGFAHHEQIPLSENLCQGEDDIGIYCWGRPSFTGWARHWKGIQLFHSPFTFVPADPDGVAVQRESLSRLEFVDILYGGYDGATKNVTPSLYVEGVPPLMNGIRVQHSAYDGVYFWKPDGPILIANSTFSHNRGHGIVIESTADGRAFINQTRIEANYGDGISYRQMHDGLSATQNLLGLEIGVPLSIEEAKSARNSAARHIGDRPRVDMCQPSAQLPHNIFFPHLVVAELRNGTLLSSDPLLMPFICSLNVALPSRLPYVYTIQFINVRNQHHLIGQFETQSFFVICNGNASVPTLCQTERYRVPILDGVLPQSVSLNSNGQPIFLGLEYRPKSDSSNTVSADVTVLFRLHASVDHKAFYGLNVTNSAVLNNTGNGIKASQIRDRFALHNVSVEGNQGLAGLLVRDGAADIWLNDTSFSWNWGDGINISYAGGSINLNTSKIVGNRWRGFSFHHNGTIPYWPLRHEVVIKGRPVNNLFFPRMLISGNAWGGVLIGNFCTPTPNSFKSIFGGVPDAKVLINWVEFSDNFYHPNVEVFACQHSAQPLMHVDLSGNTFMGGTGMGFRMEPCVNTELVVNSNKFHGIQNTALLIRNARWPQLSALPARVHIAKNDIKMNTAQFIVSIGLNEDSPHQSLVFNQQNEIRGNTVLNPFPFLKPRSTPYAALVVSSSNVLIKHNCFRNPNADFEIGTELMEHAKRIDARENNWGDPQAHNFMNRIFDQFNRYSLATIEINPYAAVCNQRAPTLTFLQQFFRQFRAPNSPFLLGGTVFENNDLPQGKYIVQDDLHITPGAKLTLTPGTTLEFMSGIGMLVQGELLRNDLSGAGPLLPIVFTGQPLGRNLPKLEQLRLVDEFGDENVLAGRLEVRLEPDGQWGTVCNRSWTAQHAQLACNQLGLTMDPQHFENWRIFPPPGQLWIVMDNIRCEEREWDLTKCRHDGTAHNVRSSCRPSEVVGLRCAPPYWAGVRYSLLANPPTITGQPTMSNWVLEKAGLFDFRTSTFGPALQIDWNYHNFFGLTIKDNFHDGLDILYNDLTRKPTIGKSLITRNRRNGMVIRSMGLSAENLRIERNGEAGVRYLPHISTVLQRNIVSWLDRAEQPELEANGIYLIPQETNEHGQKRLKFFESQLDQRKFLVAHTSSECPLTPLKPCHYELDLEAVGHEYGLPPKLVVQIVNRPNNESDEDAIFEDPQTNRRWSVRRQFIQFPLLATGPRLHIVYRRSYGPPSLVLLVLFLDAQEYLDQFVHVYDSVIYGNQYGVSAVHYSNHTTQDGAMLINRYSVEKLWFQRVNFSENSEAVIWVHSPDHVVLDGTQLAEIGWHVDNCSIVGNRGPIVDTHRDFFASANIFHWNFWSNTFANNSNAGVQVRLPDSWNLRGKLHHSFWMTENRFERNTNFMVQLSGYFAFANISSNNFTDNYASLDHGIVQLLGMEKQLVMERNRFFANFGHWMVRMETTGQLLRAEEVPAQIQYNYFQFNRFLHPTDDYVEMWPRSYTLGIFGIQKVDIHFNRFKNVLMDFELVAALQPQLAASSKEILNATHNFWGVANEAELGQRVFDVDDWNSLCAAETSPYYTTEELFINFWWGPERGQLSWSADPRTIDAPVHDLRGRIWTDRRLAYPFPYYYRPFRPYRITRDLTIMPGATLTIEKNVEVHVWPNVRILVYGSLIADATLWQPIRFKPINATEFAEQQGRRGTKYKRNTPLNASIRHSDKWPKTRKHQDRRRRFKPLDLEWRYVSMLLSQKTYHLRRRHRRIAAKHASTTSNRVDDDVFLQFPEIRRENPQKQLLNVRLMEQGQLRKDRGFLFIYNATNGELVPSCDRHFTLRNAQVVCRELGEDPQNAYSWLTPQWDYNPQLRILKTYMEPRECRGIERHLENCALRLTATLSDWQCLDSEHFNYVHCGPESALSADYVGHWGGITFARHSLEHGGGGGDDGYADERSILRHVEVVGGGRVHNDTLHGAALQVVRRAPLLQNVNVTNSSMHALQLLHPSNNIVLSRLHISDNRGIGVNILATTLHSTSDTMSGAAAAGSASSRVPRGPITIPYRIRQKTYHLRRRHRRIAAKHASTTSNRVDDDVFLQFPEIRRENPQKQLLNVRLMEQGQLRKDRGFLFIYNATNGELVPSCDRHFTLRNAQVVCRELGEDPQNAYSWLTPQWDYNPQLRILKTYMEPRECRGIERHLEHCALRLTATLSDWQCIDSEHFNYVHCGPESALSVDYVGHWGGITFARHSLEHGGGGVDDGYADERSILRHVEVVGGGRVHNDTLHGAALQVVRRAPLLQNVNVTNSSMHALQLLHPSNNIVLSRLNISDNRGIGVNILATTLHSTSDTMSGAATAGSASSRVPRGPITIPYRIPGMLDICSMGKEVKVAGRVLLYYKYDSYPVDCVKVFSSSLATGDVQRPLGFRLLQANFYQAPAGVPRPDALYVYVGTTFSSSAQLRVFNASSDLSNGVASVATQSPSLGIHLRATAADGDYGFLAEVATLPTAPISSKPVDEVSLRVSRLLNNDRGALHYRNVGEMGPNVIIEQCVMDNNGYHLYGNISTSLQAMELHVHNTMLLLFRANSLRYNRGGVLLTANSSSPLARLSAVLKSNTLAFNTNSTSLALFGNGLQQATFLNNLIAHNYALYADTILINGISSNFSHNLILSNVGWHTMDTENLNGVNSLDVPLHLLDNVFEDNWSLGHGHQYTERYGYHDGNERDEFLSKRPKRQILSQHGVSFDWWTHVGPRELSRYRSTVLIGSAHQQQIYKNLFNNPKNDFELTTTEMAGGPARFDTAVAVVDARNNYWGPPGTVGVASAKIRDQKDDPRLIRVNFMPLLASNISLREGDCSPSWFQVGHEEFKSCFLFVGASSTYLDAVQFCQALDAFMPILRNEDERREELARRIDALGQQYVTQVERHNSFGIAYDIPVWISSVTIPSNQCGWMSSRTASVGEQNCNNLLPFVCEKGTLPYREPLLWRRDFLIACICLIALLTIIAVIACCACQRAQRKAQQFPHQKTFLRESLRDKRQNHNFAPFSPVSATGLLSAETFSPSAASTLPKTVSSPTTEYESCCNSSFSTNAHRFPLASSCPTCSCTVCCCCYSATNSSSSSHFSAGEYSLPEAELNTSSSSNSTKKFGFSASSVSSDSVADQSINSDSTLTAQNVKRRNGQNWTNRNSNVNKWINESEETLCHHHEYAPPDPAPSTGYVNLGRGRTTMANIGHLRRPLPRPMANFVKRASMEDIKILETSM